MRHISSIALFALLLGCSERSETFLPEYRTGDFIESNVTGHTLKYTGNGMTYATNGYSIPRSTLASEGGMESGGLMIGRVNEALTDYIAISAPGIPLHDYDFPTDGISGKLAFSELAADSTPGCPHVDPNSVLELEVELTMSEWEGNRLTGSFTSLDPARPGVTGRFSVLVARP